MPKQVAFEDLGDVELPSELDRRIREMTAAADQDLEEVRVNFRWRRQQLTTVKQAARMMGVPYQTYIKHVVFRQALADLQRSLPAEIHH